jgi:hypothetical protein
MVAISTRSTLSANEVMIAGFVITGNQSQTVIIRAIGPTLQSLGVSGAHTDPTLTLYNAAGVVIAQNDDWSGTQSGSLAAEVGLFPLVAGSRDAVILATLPPGLYTTQVGSKGLAGDVIVEVYEVD